MLKLKSSIPTLGIKGVIEKKKKKLFNLPQVTNEC
jgi:hypothetical protein